MRSKPITKGFFRCGVAALAATVAMGGLAVWPGASAILPSATAIEQSDDGNVLPSSTIMDVAADSDPKNREIQPDPQSSPDAMPLADRSLDEIEQPLFVGNAPYGDIPQVGFAAAGEFQVSEGCEFSTSTNQLTLSGGSCTVKLNQAAPASSRIVIETTSERDAIVTFDDLVIDYVNDTPDQRSPLMILGEGTATLLLSGTNSVRTVNLGENSVANAGIGKDIPSTLVIDSAEDSGSHAGTLTAEGGIGAGIGGPVAHDGTNIIIRGGTIVATSELGAGIGGGMQGMGTDIAIEGGSVTTSSNLAAGMGSGMAAFGLSERNSVAATAGAPATSVIASGTPAVEGFDVLSGNFGIGYSLSEADELSFARDFVGLLVDQYVRLLLPVTNVQWDVGVGTWTGNETFDGICTSPDDLSVDFPPASAVTGPPGGGGSAHFVGWSLDGGTSLVDSGISPCSYFDSSVEGELVFTAAFGQLSELVVTPESAGSFDPVKGLWTVTEDATVTMAHGYEVAETNNVVIETGLDPLTVTFEGVRIDHTNYPVNQDGIYVASPVSVTGTGAATLLSRGRNVFASVNQYAGLWFGRDTHVTLNEDATPAENGANSFEFSGGAGAAGIGASLGARAGRLTIAGGEVRAHGGGGAAAIGGALSGDVQGEGNAEDILISGGTVTATGGGFGVSAIGGSVNSTTGPIIISGNNPDSPTTVHAIAPNGIGIAQGATVESQSIITPNSQWWPNLGTGFGNIETGQWSVDADRGYGSNVTIVTPTVVNSLTVVDNGGIWPEDAETLPERFTKFDPEITLVAVLTPGEDMGTFFGWHSSLAPSVSDSTTVTIPQGTTVDVVLTAVFANSVTVSFDANAEGDPVSGTVASIVGEERGTVIVSTNEFIRPGHIFVGWNTSADGDGLPLDEGDPLVLGSEDLTLYAQWEAAEDVAVAFVANHADAVGVMDPVGVAFQGEFVVPESGFRVPGFTFVGWSSEPDGSGTVFPVDDVVVLSQDLTLYAQWERVEGGTGTDREKPIAPETEESPTGPSVPDSEDSSSEKPNPESKGPDNSEESALVNTGSDLSALVAALLLLLAGSSLIWRGRTRPIAHQ